MFTAVQMPPSPVISDADIRSRASFSTRGTMDARWLRARLMTDPNAGGQEPILGLNSRPDLSGTLTLHTGVKYLA